MSAFQIILINIVSDQLSAAITSHVLPLLRTQLMHGFEPLLRAFMPPIW